MKTAEEIAKYYTDVSQVTYSMKEYNDHLKEMAEEIGSYAKQHAIKFAKHFHNTTHFIVDEQAFERDYTVWIKNKEQPTPSGE